MENFLASLYSPLFSNSNAALSFRSPQDLSRYDMNKEQRIVGVFLKYKESREFDIEFFRNFGELCTTLM